MTVVRVGLLGLGTVGSGVAEILARHSKLIAARTGVELKIACAAVRRSKKKRGGAAGRVKLVKNASAVVTSTDVDVVVELMGGVDQARQHILAALDAGKSVVTANKAVLAAHGPELFKAAKQAERDLYFEAAVAGGVPIIRSLREGLASDRITSVCGILNGTTNYILGQMQQGKGYLEALKAAQDLGFAEADPTLDVTGRDAADKLAILTYLAYGRAVLPKVIPCDGITSMTPEIMQDAERLGYRVKLLAIARRGSNKGVEHIDARVHPCFIPAGHVLGNVPDAQNAVALVSDALGPTLYQGAGAGGLPTGSAVVSDIIESARDFRAGISGRVSVEATSKAPKILTGGKSVSAYYLRLRVADKPGVLAAITAALARQKVSLATVLQRDRAVEAGGLVPVVITTHPTEAGSMEKAIKALQRSGALKRAPDVVRIEAEL